MIKALFFDLDGTLLSGEKTILPNARKALKKCREKGIKVFLATARSPMLDRMLGWGGEEFSLFDGGIYCNGACECVGDSKEYTYIDPDVVGFCMEQAAEFEDVHMSLHLKDEIHAFNHVLPEFAMDFWGLDRDGIEELSEACYDRTVKILIYYGSMVDSRRALPEELYGRIKAHCEDRANIYLTDRGKTIQVVKKHTNKYAAIEKVRKGLSIERDEVAVFGDDINDVEMLSRYKNSVAMGNAGDDVKRVAGYATLSNDEDGIAYALEKILKVI